MILQLNTIWEDFTLKCDVEMPQIADLRIQYVIRIGSGPGLNTQIRIRLVNIIIYRYINIDRKKLVMIKCSGRIRYSEILSETKAKELNLFDRKNVRPSI